MLARIGLAALILLTGGEAGAYTENANVRKEVAADPERALPHGDRYALAVDGWLFKDFNSPDYFHGNGYWVENRFEVAPVEQLEFNLKLVAFNGASSYGYARGSLLHNFVGVTARSHTLCEGCEFFVRGSDVGRQTLGAGLTLDQEEINGGVIEFRRGPWRYKGVASGTAGYFIDNDFMYHQLDWGDNRAGLWVQQFVDPILPPFIGAYSVLPLGSGFTLRTETVFRNAALASLAGARWEGRPWSGLRITVGYQFRHYDDHFGDDLVGNVQFDYLGYDTRDKDFTNVKTVFLFDDDLNVHAGKAELAWSATDWLEFFSNSETGVFLFRSRPSLSYFFTSSGVTFYPVAGRHESLSVYATNKFFPYSPSNPLAPSDPLDQYHSLPPFFDRLGVATEAKFRF